MTTLFNSTARKITLALAFAASFSAVSSTASFAFSSEAQQHVHRRRLPPLQLGNPEYSEDHRLHDQAQIRSERGLPHRDGQGSRPEERQIGRAVICTLQYLAPGNACVDATQAFSAFWGRSAPVRGRFRRSEALPDGFPGRIPGPGRIFLDPGPVSTLCRVRYRTVRFSVPDCESTAHDQASFRYSACPDHVGRRGPAGSPEGPGRLCARRLAVLPGADAGGRSDRAGLPEDRIARSSARAASRCWRATGSKTSRRLSRRRDSSAATASCRARHT